MFLSFQVGIEMGDIIDELLGQPLLKVKNGKVSADKVLHRSCFMAIDK